MAISLLLAASQAAAATRPRYGGTLRVEVQSQGVTLERTNPPDSVGLSKLESLLFDRLVRLDPRGQPQPGLATWWEHDADSRRWRFKLRTAVKWHDGPILTPDEVLSSLERAAPDIRVRLDADMLEFEARESSPELLFDLATGEEFVIRRASPENTDGLPVGTGPFRLVEWQTGRRAILQAHDEYWGGRPYLDRIEIELGRASRDQLLDLELGRADVVQLDPAEARRAQQDGRKVWASAPVNLLALRFDTAKVPNARLREAVAYSIDRAAIVRALRQNFGEAVGGFLPQWLSGYAFLHSTVADLARARELKSATGAATAIRVGYHLSNPMSRPIVERIAVNARDAGISIQAVALSRPAQTAAEANTDALLTHVRLPGPTPRQAFLQAARRFSIAPESLLSGPEEIYVAETRALEGFAIVPLVCVPEIVGLGPGVRNWSPTRWGEWGLEDVWLEAEKP